MNVSVKNFGFAFGYEGSALSVGFNTDNHVVRYRSAAKPEPVEGHVLSYSSEVTPEILAAVQANSDRFAGDDTWEIVDADDEVDPKP